MDIISGRIFIIYRLFVWRDEAGERLAMVGGGRLMVMSAL